MAFPTNSTRFIKGELCGIRRFRASPDKNAPMIASTWARKDPRNTITSTNIYCDILSCTCLKNQRPMKGKPNNTINANIKMETPRRIQNISLTCPVAMPTMIVRTSNANVWEANILASKTEVNTLNCRTHIPTTVPRIIGMRNVYMPKARLFVLFLLKSAISISNPARNMI